MKPIKAAFFDLDDYLGYFEKVFYKNERREIPENNRFVRLELREGIIRTLADLKMMDFSLFVTSSASEIYAKDAVEIAGISHFFDAVYGKSETIKEGAVCKHYRRIVEEVLGYTPEEASERLVILGNAEADKPADMPGIVHVQEPAGAMSSAKVTKMIIDMLLKEGSGNFKRGFDAVHKRNDLMMEDSPEAGRIGIIDEEINYITRYESNTMELLEGDLINPVMRILLEGPKYRAKPVKLQMPG